MTFAVQLHWVSLQSLYQNLLSAFCCKLVSAMTSCRFKN